MAPEKGGDERSVEAAERSPANAEMKPLTLAEQAKKAIGEAAEDARRAADAKAAEGRAADAKAAKDARRAAEAEATRRQTLPSAN